MEAPLIIDPMKKDVRIIDLMKKISKTRYHDVNLSFIKFLSFFLQRKKQVKNQKQALSLIRILYF